MTFTNAILAGETLVRNSIQSEDFVSGSEGWSLPRTGDAELNSAVVRAAIIVGTDDTISLNTSGPYTDLTLEGDNTRIIQTMDDLAALYSQELDKSFNGDYYLTMGEIVHDLSNTRTYFFNSTNERGTVFDNDGYLKHFTATGFDLDYFDIETWHEFGASTGTTADPGNFSNSWTNLGSNWETAGYRKMPDGSVWLKGVVYNGTLSDGTIMATLPTGYRPSKDKIFMGGNASASGTTPSVRVFASDGTIRIYGVSGTVSGAHSWDGLCFTASDLT